MRDGEGNWIALKPLDAKFGLSVDQIQVADLIQPYPLTDRSHSPTLSNHIQPYPLGKCADQPYPTLSNLIQLLYPLGVGEPLLLSRAPAPDFSECSSFGAWNNKIVSRNSVDKWLRSDPGTPDPYLIPPSDSIRIQPNPT